MSTKEWEAHEAYVDHVNELMTKYNRMVVGVSTCQHDIDDDISSIIIKIAPTDNEPMGDSEDEYDE